MFSTATEEVTAALLAGTDIEHFHHFRKFYKTLLPSNDDSYGNIDWIRDKRIRMLDKSENYCNILRKR